MPDEGSLQIPATSPPPLPPAVAGGRTRNPSALPGMLGAVLGLLGLIAGVAAWFRAAPADEAAKPAYSEQQAADAKQAVCDAYAKGERAIQAAGARTADRADWLPVAVNSRLAETTSGSFLIDVLQANPATSPELRDLTERLAITFQDAALIQLADRQDDEADRTIVHDLTRQIDQLCR